MGACGPRWCEGRRWTGKEREGTEARRDCEAQIRLRQRRAEPKRWIDPLSTLSLNSASPIYDTHPRCAHDFLRRLCVHQHSYMLLTSYTAETMIFLVDLELGQGQSSAATASCSFPKPSTAMSTPLSHPMKLSQNRLLGWQWSSLGLERILAATAVIGADDASLADMVVIGALDTDAKIGRARYCHCGSAAMRLLHVDEAPPPTSGEDELLLRVGALDGAVF
jgi:hypothetical protein